MSKQEFSDPGLVDIASVLRSIREDMKDEFEWRKSHSDFATGKDLERMEKRIMSAISDFAAKQNAFNDRQSAAIDAAVASVTGLTEDVQTLNDKITELQNSVGTVTPEDQALLDEITTQGEALSTKMEGVASALQALDALTPPKPPVA